MDMRMVRFEAKRVIRTAQTFFPGLADVKSAAQLRLSRVLRRPFESDFGALRLFGREPGRLYVDVGANRGQSIAAIRMTANQPSIVSFEANPIFADRLRRQHEAEPDVRIEPVGLGAAEGTFGLHIPSYRGYVFDGLASLDRDAAMSWIGPRAVLWFDPAKLGCETLTCMVKTLDSFALAPFFMKIDVEKFETEVLRGSNETLTRHQPILLIESDNPEVGTMLRELDYQPFVYDCGKHCFRAGDGIGNSFFVPRAKLNLIETAVRGLAGLFLAAGVTACLA